MMFPICLLVKGLPILTLNDFRFPRVQRQVHMDFQRARVVLENSILYMLASALLEGIREIKVWAVSARYLVF